MPAHLTLRLTAVSHSLLARNRKVTRRHSTWGRAVVGGLILVTAGVMLTSLIWAWINLQIVTLNYQISQAQETMKQYLEINRKLRVELSNLKAISRLEKLAAETYGMSAPQPRQVIYLP
jgi:cell division protein FtsL|uniref:Cell division protein FtsL n=1 Tax=Desulfobacca acetoxidans TaxID=60893 RepID=A0A7C3SK38_9BACT